MPWRNFCEEWDVGEMTVPSFTKWISTLRSSRVIQSFRFRYRRSVFSTRRTVDAVRGRRNSTIFANAGRVPPAFAVSLSSKRATTLRPCSFA